SVLHIELLKPLWATVLVGVSIDCKPEADSQALESSLNLPPQSHGNNTKYNSDKGVDCSFECNQSLSDYTQEWHKQKSTTDTALVDKGLQKRSLNASEFDQCVNDNPRVLFGKGLVDRSNVLGERADSGDKVAGELGEKSLVHVVSNLQKQLARSSQRIKLTGSR